MYVYVSYFLTFVISFKYSSAGSFPFNLHVFMANGFLLCNF